MSFRLRFSLAALLVTELAVAAAPRAVTRHSVDVQDLAELGRTAPHAAQLFERAESALAEGDWSRAERFLSEARREDQTSFVLARRHCQVLTELGQRRRALEACHDALTGATAMDERAYVGALLSGPKPLTPEELGRALHEATNARALRGQVFSDAAFCEIARKLADEAAFRGCLARLQALAPEHFETARFERVQWGGLPSSIYAAFWLGLLGLAAFALVRGVRTGRRRAAAALPPTSGGSAFLALALLSVSAPVHAEPRKLQLSDFAVDFEHPERTRIPTVEERNQNPLQFGYFLQDVATEAFRAERQGNPQKAVKLWEVSAKAVPDQAVAFGHACRVHQQLGERAQALEYCGAALNLQGVTHADYVRFAEVMVAKPTALSRAEVDDLVAVIEHLRSQPGAEGPAAAVECRLGVKLGDRKRLERCAPTLARLTPGDPHALTYQWALAIARRDYGDARRWLGELEKSKMTRAALAQLRAQTDERASLWRRPFEDPRYGFPLLGLVLIGGLLALRLRSKATPAVAVKAAPSSG